ncbi:rhodanese-like domain-containing protein [Aquimarina agarilytica]|uniref:rhodanese-like domain-containing protein n=1 Tax=Aquimarina agarilytica TaxID=1087449 RepID=UPI000288A4F1|nr:rhodanese-like domain-containing protein [Aquimarina agarilytica]
MKKIFLLIALAIVSTCMGQQTKALQRVGFATLKNEINISETIQLVDVRTKKEFSSGAIERAINIPIENKEKFKQQVQHLNKNKPIYVYCHSGYRSKVASAILRDLNFKYIYDFSGGWKLWSQMTFK